VGRIYLNRVAIYETIRKLWTDLGSDQANQCCHGVAIIHLSSLLAFSHSYAYHDCIFGRMLLKSQAHLLEPERYVLDAARRSIQLRGYYSTLLITLYNSFFYSLNLFNKLYLKSNLGFLLKMNISKLDV
jgi:hypothetical protein